MIEFSSDASDFALVYHWWSTHADKRVWRHLDVPILLSLATLRVHSPELRVYVIDHSDGSYEWGDYPARFNFSLIPQPAVLEASFSKKEVWTFPSGGPYIGRGPLPSASERPEHTLDALDVRRCSRPLDMSELAIILPERYLISSDCDVFWLKPVLPLSGDAELFNVRTVHPGFFYFDKEAERPRRLLELWQAYVCLACRDFNFRRRLVMRYPHPAVVSPDKVFACIRDDMSEVFNTLVAPIQPTDMLMPSDYYDISFDDDVLGSIRGLHVTSGSMGRNKGKFAMLFRELFDLLRNQFSTEELIDMFQMSVFNNSVYALKDLYALNDGSFVTQLTERMRAEVRPL